MKRKILAIVAFVIIVSLAVGAFILMNKKPKKETGEINEPETEEYNIVTGKVDENLYKELTEYAYKGEIKYRNLIFIFEPTDYNAEYALTKYECTVIDEDADKFEFPSYYSVILTDKKMSLEYITGNIESTFECTYENGDLTINGVKMEKVPLDSVNLNTYEGNFHSTTEIPEETTTESDETTENTEEETSEEMTFE